MGKIKVGFTLIELLVVVAIIAVLVAILLPALGRARELAMRVICASNMRTCGQGIFSYSSDYGDYLPLAGGPDGGCPWILYRWGWNYVGGPPWYGLGKLFEYDYVLTGKVFFCPSANKSTDMKMSQEHCVILDHSGGIRDWDYAANKLSIDNRAYVGILQINSSFMMVPKWDPGVIPGRTPGWRSTYSKVRNNITKCEPRRAILLDFYQFWRFPPDRVYMGNHNSEGTNVLHLDGHVNWVDGQWYLDGGKEDIVYDLE